MNWCGSHPNPLPEGEGITTLFSLLQKNLLPPNPLGEGWGEGYNQGRNPYVCGYF